MKPIFLTLCVLSNVPPVGLCPSTPLQGLPLAEQKIEFLSEHLHFPAEKARDVQQNGWRNFLKTQNSANWSRETRTSQCSWQQLLHSWIHPKNPCGPGCAVKTSFTHLCSLENGSWLSSPPEQGSHSAGFSPMHLPVLLSLRADALLQCNWGFLWVWVGYSGEKTVLWTSLEEAALTRGKTDRSVIGLLMQPASKQNIEPWTWGFFRSAA